MNSAYVMTFNTDKDRRVTLRVNRAVYNLPRATVVEAMDKILTANPFDPANGNLIGRHSLKAVQTTAIPIDLG
jgi:lactate dehydrogenase-like 2-hydroxyacid dehydrogenase